MRTWGIAEREPLWDPLWVLVLSSHLEDRCVHTSFWQVGQYAPLGQLSPVPGLEIPPEGEMSLLCRFSTAFSLNSKQERKNSQPSLPSSLTHPRHWM